MSHSLESIARRRRPLARNLLPPLSIKTGGWVGPACVLLEYAAGKS